jgi:hypothetical protein
MEKLFATFGKKLLQKTPGIRIKMTALLKLSDVVFMHESVQSLP